MPTSKASKAQRQKQTPRKSKYDVISYAKRKELIKLVFGDQVSIYRASRLVGINNATAKVIIRKYRQQGTVFVRKSEKIMNSNEQSESNEQQQSINGLEKSNEEQAPIQSPQNNFQSMFSLDYACQPAQYYLYPTYYLYTSAFF